MSRPSLLILTALASYLVFASPSVAQTVSEALDFLRQKAPCSAPEALWQYPAAIERKVTKSSFEGSDWRLILKEETHHTIFLTVKKKFFVDWTEEKISLAPFSDLNLDVRFKGRKVSLECLTGDCFNIQENGYGLMQSGAWQNNDGKWIYSHARTEEYTFCDELTATRIAKALRFLIKSAGGKESPF